MAAPNFQRDVAAEAINGPRRERWIRQWYKHPQSVSTETELIKRLVQCCLVGTTTSSLALRATANGGCGLDLAAPTRPLASKPSTARCADMIGSIPPKGKTTCLLSGD
jgi:hypothetical protein